MFPGPYTPHKATTFSSTSIVWNNYIVLYMSFIHLKERTLPSVRKQCNSYDVNDGFIVMRPSWLDSKQWLIKPLTTGNI